MHADCRPIARAPNPSAVRALLAGIIDYAGLFPPAGLDLAAAVGNYAAYCAGPDAWALGRFVIPAGRLQEMAALIEALEETRGKERWCLSAVVGPEPETDLRVIGRFNEEWGGGWGEVDAVEFRSSNPVEIRERVHELPPDVTVYVEIPIEHDPRPLIDAIAESGSRAKVRTGGVTPEAFPTQPALLRFLRACTEADLPFKATAGLHHPVAGRYPLTYERASPKASMFGYLNLLFATALLRRGEPDRRAAAALGESDPSAFHLSNHLIAWRGECLSRDEIETLREHGMVSFGSCSFREPLDELPATSASPRTDIPRAVNCT